MNVLRIIKSLLVGSVALFALLVAWNNVVDYGSNFEFVRHVLSMDTTFEGNTLMHRAITRTELHHAAYWLIIATEAATGLLCALGCVQMLRARHADATAFEHAKQFASIGLFLGILLWSAGFMTVGAEYFLMWQSADWNGQAAASRFIVILFATLIFLHQSEPQAR